MNNLRIRQNPTSLSHRGVVLLQPEKNKWPIFLTVAVGVFMSTLDSSMVNIALPSIMDEFASPLQTTEWVVMIYLLTITSSLLVWGNLSDRIGRGKVYSSGMFIFAVGSLACAYSPSLSWLIASRFLQALGAAMMMSTGPAIIKETFPPEQLGRSLGLIGISVSLGLMTGPSLGGFLIEYFSWRSIFFLTVPIGFLFSYLARAVIPMHKKLKITKRFDWLGGVAWAITLLFASFAFSHATSPDWSYQALVLFLLAAGVSFFVFYRLETITPHPLLPLHLFHQKFFSAAIFSAILSFTVLFSVIMLTPFYLDRVIGLSSSRIGLIMMAIPMTVMGVAPLAGWLSDHIGARFLSTFGLLVSSAGLFLLAGLTPDSRPVEVAARLALLGCGQAMFLSPNSASVLRRVKTEFIGASAALLATARNLGMLLGIALAGLVFTVLFSRLTGGLDMKDFSTVHTDHFMSALKYAYLTAAATGILGALISWMRGKGKAKAIAGHRK